MARQRTGLWALICRAGHRHLAALLVLRLGRWAHLQQTVSKGVLGSVRRVFNTASEVGYSAVIASLAGFVVIRDAVASLLVARWCRRRWP